MTDSTRQFKELFETLIADVDSLFHSLLNDNSFTTRRSYVRAVFALFEGVSYAMKQMALDTQGLSSEPFTGAEMAILREESYSLDNTGRVQSRPANVAFLPNIRFAFYSLVKGYNAKYALPVSGAGWQALQRALTVRHRLMHPKSKNNLDISDEELECVGIAFRWFVSNVALALKEIVVALKDATGAEDVDIARLEQIRIRYEPHAK